MKEVRFHPKAKAEMQESVRFYEARFEGLGFRFLSAGEQTSERISAHRAAAIQPHRRIPDIVYRVSIPVRMGVIPDIFNRESILDLYRWIPATHCGYDGRGEGSLGSLPPTRRYDCLHLKSFTAAN